MIQNLPIYISLIFGLTTVVTLLLFIWSITNAASEKTRKKSIPVLIGLTIWLVLQMILTLNNIYNTGNDTMPPRILVFGTIPAMLAIVLLFVTRSGRQFLDSLPLKNLTYLNVVRIPVELVLFWLCLEKAVPEIMTFEGRNFDILSGITAPFIAYFGLTKFKLNRRIILAWNVICLGLLINIVVIALCSAPSPLQQFAFEQPNMAILNFPFNWLPTFIVPIVLLGHLVSIRQLMPGKRLVALQTKANQKLSEFMRKAPVSS